MGTIFLVIFSVCEVYMDGGYLQVVEECVRPSMAKAAEVVKALPNLASYPGPHITVFPLEGLVTMVCACA